MGRLPRGTIRENWGVDRGGIKPLGGGRSWTADMSRLRRRVAAGRSVKLYRGERVMGSKGRMHRLRSVRKGQSWAMTPHLALEFARPTGSRAGAGGVLYSITVPAGEMKDLLNRPVDHWITHERHPSRPRGKWAAIRDTGTDLEFGRQRLEIRPNRDRPDLKPKIVGTVGLDRNLEALYGFTRRLSRRRGGVPVRGGGA